VNWTQPQAVSLNLNDDPVTTLGQSKISDGAEGQVAYINLLLTSQHNCLERFQTWPNHLLLLPRSIEFSLRLPGLDGLARVAREAAAVGGDVESQSLHMPTASRAVALGALGQEQPTRLAQNLQTKRLFIVIPVYTSPTLLTASDARVAASALPEGQLAALLARRARAVVHHPRRPALGAHLHVDAAGLLDGGRGLPILVELGRSRGAERMAGTRGHHHGMQSFQSLGGDAVDAADAELSESRGFRGTTLGLLLHHSDDGLRTHLGAARKTQLKPNQTSHYNPSNKSHARNERRNHVLEMASS